MHLFAPTAKGLRTNTIRSSVLTAVAGGTRVLAATTGSTGSSGPGATGFRASAEPNVRRLVLVLVAVPFLALALVLASAALDQPYRYYRDAVVVEASRERIWALLTEFDGYDEWNPYITRASGNAAEGTTLELTRSRTARTPRT